MSNQLLPKLAASTERLKFERVQPEPTIAGATSADVLELEGELIWYVAILQEKKERIVGLSVADAGLSAPFSLDVTKARPAVVPGWAGSFDTEGAFDPAALVLGSTIVLFYSASNGRFDSIGRATSTDGARFVKYPWPVVAGRAPEAAHHRGRFYLFYVAAHSGKGYAIYLAKSTDGVHFHHYSSVPVLNSGPSGAWDSHSVTTPRVFSHQGVHYMLYAGSDCTGDEPQALGLARSVDFAHWQRYALNPVFTLGPPGSWDDKALSFGTVFKWGDVLYLAYRGIGHVHPDGGGAVSSVGLAAISADSFERAVADENEWST